MMWRVSVWRLMSPLTIFVMLINPLQTWIPQRWISHPPQPRLRKDGRHPPKISHSCLPSRTSQSQSENKTKAKTTKSASTATTKHKTKNPTPADDDHSHAPAPTTSPNAAPTNPSSRPTNLVRIGADLKGRTESVCLPSLLFLRPVSSVSSFSPFSYRTFFSSFPLFLSSFLHSLSRFLTFLFDVSLVYGGRRLGRWRVRCRVL